MFNMSRKEISYLAGLTAICSFILLILRVIIYVSLPDIPYTRMIIFILLGMIFLIPILSLRNFNELLKTKKKRICIGILIGFISGIFLFIWIFIDIYMSKMPSNAFDWNDVLLISFIWIGIWISIGIISSLLSFLYMKKKKSIQTIFVAIIITLALVFGVILSEKHVTASLDTLNLTFDDIPDGYQDSPSGIMGMAEDLGSIESSYMHFAKGANFSDPMNLSYIHCKLLKYSNVERAKLNYNEKEFRISKYGDHDLINESVNVVGDESIAGYFTSYMYNSTISFSFRILNVLVEIRIINEDYSLAFDLAKIIENRINESLN